jgi:hypothetical protein
MQPAGLAEEFAGFADFRGALLIEELVERYFHDVCDGVSAVSLEPFDPLLSAAVYVGVERHFGGFFARLKRRCRGGLVDFGSDSLDFASTFFAGWSGAGLRA